jgi:putative aldouronate transport system substrate-binding protein
MNKKPLRIAAGALGLAGLAFGLALLASCGGKKDAAAAGATSAGTKTPITFKLYNADASEDMPYTDPVAKKIALDTGVSLEVDRPVGGSNDQTIPLMIAAGEYPDLIYAKGSLNMLIEAGAVLALDELIEKYGANMKKLYGSQFVRLKTSNADPRIYQVGTYGVNAAFWETNGVMNIQHAVLKELGYPPMKTLDDYERAIKAYLAKYPVIDGQKTIGMSLLVDTWQWLIDVGNIANYLIGCPDDGQWVVDQKSFEATYKFLVPGMEKYIKWLCRMNAEGVLDPDSFTQKEDVWKAKIASGRVLAIAYPNWGYNDARTALVGEGKPERTYAYLPITAEPGYASPSLKNYGYGGGWGIAISTACKDPERAMEFIDYMCKEETQILTNWGIEGANYTVVNGKRVQTPEDFRMEQTDPDYGKKTGVGRWNYPFPQYGQGFIDSTGNYMTHISPDTVKERYLPVERETLAAYGVEMWTDLFPPSESLGISKHGQAWQYTLPPDVNAKLTEADDLSKRTIANLVLGKPADFDAGWAKFMAELKALGIEEANAAMTGLVKDKMRLWGNL